MIPPLRSKPNAAEKPQHLEKSKAERTSGDKRKSKSPQQSKQQGQLTKGDDEQELAPERCQHIQFLDCDKQLGRVIFECWHCHQGIICEYTGEPVMGEYKGRPSLIQMKVQCPNYEVYRQVVKAYPQKTPLELTLGVNDNSVEKAEPVSK